MPTLTATELFPDLGASIEALETPALLVDLDIMERNIDWYAGFADQQGIQLRSHVKTHKTPALAHLQTDRTDGGICCQTLSEAEVMAAGGIDDIYLSYMVIGEQKLNRMIRLSEQLTSFATTVDGRDNVDPLQSTAAANDTTINVIMEIDVGLGRTGVPTYEGAINLGEYIVEQPNLSFQGILAYESHVKSRAESEAEFEQYCEAAMDEAAGVVAGLEDRGIEVPEVKAGGTATSLYSGTHDCVTEINPGMYPFMDVGELELRPWDVTIDDCAASVLSTVISAPAPDRAVVDAGSKSLGMDKPQQPLPRESEEIEYVASSEEHGWLETEERSEPLAVGDRVSLVTPHVCTTINLHDTIVGVRDDRVETVWDIQARGKIK